MFLPTSILDRRADAPKAKRFSENARRTTTSMASSPLFSSSTLRPDRTRSSIETDTITAVNSAECADSDGEGAVRKRQIGRLQCKVR